MQRKILCNLFALLTILMLFGCKAVKAPAVSASPTMPAQQTPTVAPTPTASDAPVMLPSPIPTGDSVTVRYEQALNPSLKPLLFELDMQRPIDDASGQYTVREIRVFDTQTNLLIQRIIPGENTQLTADPMNQGTPEGFILEDMNFDGYLDMQLMQFLPASPNVPYYYWLWDPQQKQFVQNTLLEQITSPEFDPATKRIYSTQRGSANSYISQTYEYVKNVPTLMESVEETYHELTRKQAEALSKQAATQPANASFVLKQVTTQKRVNNQMATTQDEAILLAQTPDGQEKELATFAPDDPAVAPILSQD